MNDDRCAVVKKNHAALSVDGKNAVISARGVLCAPRL